MNRGAIIIVKLTTVHKAKEEIGRLKILLKLVESCYPTTPELTMIKEYACLGSLNKAVEKLNSVGMTITRRPVGSADVSDAIKAKGNDELHKIVRSGYLYKTRAARRKTRYYPNW